LQIYLDLTGECYINIVKDSIGRPREFYFRQPDKMSPVVKDGIIDHYIERVGLSEKRYETKDILYFKYPSPTNPYRGASPVQRKAYAYDTDKYNMIYQLNVFKNGVHLKQVLESEKNIPPDQVKKILTLFDQTYGGAEKAHKTGALVGGMTLKTVGVSNKDMEFMLLAEWTMRQLASAYHTPPQKLSHPENTNLANMTALDTAWNRECILPRLVRQEEVFNTFLLPMYGDKGLYCKYDNPVPVDNEFRLKQRESNLKNYVISPNEARVEDGLDEVDWGKLPLAPFSIAPLDVSKPAKPKPELEPEKTIKAIKTVKYTAEYKKRFWELFIKRITPHENEFKRGIIRLFQEQENRALRALRKSKAITKDVDDVLRITHDEREIMKFTEFALPRITEMVKINGEAAAAELGLGFDITNPEVIKWIKKHTGESIKSILDTTFDALKRTLAEGVANGESIPNLAARITEEYNQCKGYKAIRIARTETISSTNQGALQAYKQSGVVEKKEWLISADACDICIDIAAGGAVGINELFKGGFDVPPAHPNCRCSIIPVIKD